MRFLILAMLLASTSPAQAQTSEGDLIAAQRNAIGRLDRLHGIWRGPATTQTANGPHQITQTERIGGFLDGTLIVIEGHGYNPDGSSGFHAFGVISYDPAAKAYAIRSYAQGRSGTFPMTVIDAGYVWTTPAGGGATIRYTATITKDHWNEVGDYLAANQPPRRIFEMNLTRIGDTDWPAAGGVTMK